MYRLTSIITSLLSSGPLYIVWLGALGFAAMKWQAHPRTAMLVVIASAASLLSAIVAMFLTWVIPTVMSATGMGYEGMGWLYGAVGFFHSIISAAAFATLVYAAFQAREEYAPAS